MLRLICAICFALFSIVARAEFFEGTDIPLMEGMQVDESDSFSFDAPAGQIVGYSATVSSPVHEVRDFYQASLVELGWQQKSSTKYVRDNDELVLQFVPRKQKTTVKMQYTFSNR